MDRDKSALQQLTPSEIDLLKTILATLPEDVYCIVHRLNTPPEVLTVSLNCTDAISVIFPKKTA